MARSSTAPGSWRCSSAAEAQHAACGGCALTTWPDDGSVDEIDAYRPSVVNGPWVK